MLCKNCEHTISDNSKYCPECGLRIIDKLTVGELFNNFIKNYFSVDARFLKSFFPLIFKPGNLPDVFIKGKRLKYLHPVQFYLFISLMFFFLLSIITKHQGEEFDEYLERGFDRDRVSDTITANDTDTINSPTITYTFDNKKLDSLISINASKEEKLKVIGYQKGDNRFSRHLYSQGLKIYERSGRGIWDVFFDTIPITLFFFLPVFAFILKLLFYKTERYSHHLVFSFYFFTFFFLMYAVLLILNTMINVPFWIFLLIVIVYLIFGIKRFYRKKFGLTFLRALILIIINLILLLPFSLLLAFIIILVY